MTDEEIQKMQDLEQAQLDKAYEIGYQIGYEDAIASRIEKDLIAWLKGEEE